MTKDEALKEAIMQLWSCSMLMNLDHSDYLYEDVIAAHDACKEALDTEQVREDLPAQEPVAWMHIYDGEVTEFNDFKACDECEPLYTHPHQWQGLTDDEILDLEQKHTDLLVGGGTMFHFEEFARAIEQALKDKNSV